MSHTLYYQPFQDLEINSTPQFYPLNTYDDGNEYTFHISQDQFCTLESSSYTSPPTVSSSPSDTLFHHEESQLHPVANCSSPLSSSCLTEDLDELKQKLKELETVMLGPYLDIHEKSDTCIASADFDSWRQLMMVIPTRDVKKMLIACAKAVSNNDSLMAQWLMSELRQIVSVSGDSIERLGAYMLEGLVARINSSGSFVYKSFKCKKPARNELLSCIKLRYEICPYFKFGYMSANGAIAEAMKDEERVHIIDFQIGQGSQWVSLIRAFAGRPGGPPHLRITGIDDLTSAYAHGGGLSIVGRRLSKLAMTFNIPFEFHIASIDLTNLEIRANEAVAGNFVFMLQRMQDESVSTENHRDRLLRMVKGLNPKVVTLVEQECNTNTAAFFPRFLEVLDYYTALFESIDVMLPRHLKERINLEQHCLAKEVVNVIACEGVERVERHEPIGKWRSRFKMAGFSPSPLNSLVNVAIKTLLKSYCKKYRVEERDGGLYLGWSNRDLVASCAWK